ncbi:MAG: hypothetical protein K2Y35_10820 [Burkholderiales bacterium]|nr:hypothetical protein [Burkholderiales bacterium]
MSESVYGFIDYGITPYALGDTFTLLMNLEVERLVRDKSDIAQFVLSDPRAPNSRLQPFINTNNFRNFLIELFPAYLFSPSTSRWTFTEDRSYFYHQLVSRFLKRQAIWPSLLTQARGAIDFFSHRAINRFFERHGHLPKLAPPEDLRKRAIVHLARLFPGRQVVTVNLRNSKSGYFFTAPHREAAIPEWDAFFSMASQSHPHVAFLIVGSFNEWNRSVLGHPNVTVARRVGLTLADELAILMQSRAFMGSSSGFSALATFSSVPYVITNFEAGAAKYVGLEVGARRYPFATEHQVILWGKEEASVLHRQLSEHMAGSAQLT